MVFMRGISAPNERLLRMKHTRIRRILSLLCAAALLLTLGACAPIDTVKGWFTGGKWVDDKPYETYNLDKYISPGEYKGVEASIDPLTEESIRTDAGIYFSENQVPFGVEDDPSKTVTAKGDVVLFSFAGAAEGISEETLASMQSPPWHYLLILGSGNFIPKYDEEYLGFEDQMVGQPRDKEFDVNVKFPEDYGEPELQDKPVTFKCKIFEIGAEAEKMTDTGVQQMTGGQLETVQELLDYVENTLRENNLQSAFDAAYNKMEIIKLPPREQKYWDDQLVQDAQRQGAGGPDEYAQWNGYDDAAAFRDDQIKRELFAYAIAHKEGLTVSDEEVQALLGDIREGGEAGTDAEIFSKFGGKGRLMRHLMQNKAAEFILENAKAAS